MFVIFKNTIKIPLPDFTH